MMSLRKTLMLFIFCFAVSTANAATHNIIRDTLIKITITPVAEINPKSRIIEMQLHNRLFKTSYTGAENINRELAFNDPLYKSFVDLIGELAGPNFNEHTESGFDTSRVLDGSIFNFEIITPAATRRIRVHEPDAEHYPLLRKLLDLSTRLFQDKRP